MWCKNYYWIDSVEYKFVFNANSYKINSYNESFIFKIEVASAFQSCNSLKQSGGRNVEQKRKYILINTSRQNNNNNNNNNI